MTIDHTAINARTNVIHFVSMEKKQMFADLERLTLNSFHITLLIRFENKRVNFDWKREILTSI